MTRMTEQQLQARQRKTRHTDADFTCVDGGKGRFRRDLKPKGRKPRPRHENGSMNAGEQAYARHLDSLLSAGEIAGWWYELITIKLADRLGQPVAGAGVKLRGDAVGIGERWRLGAFVCQLKVDEVLQCG